MTLPDVQSAKITPTEIRKKAMRDKAVEIMREHLDQSDYSLDDLATELHISSRQLQRILRDLPHGGFRAELCYWRMIEAARLLSDGKTAIISIAPKVGYRQPMHFAKAFRRQFNCSPRQWRARCALKIKNGQSKR